MTRFSRDDFLFLFFELIPKFLPQERERTSTHAIEMSESLSILLKETCRRMVNNAAAQKRKREKCPKDISANVIFVATDSSLFFCSGLCHD